MEGTLDIEIPGYRVIRDIGVGGMATAYLAIQEGFDREVVLKILSPSLAVDESFGERFIREARIVGQLAHPNIVPVYDVGEFNGLFYLAMEYVPGGELKAKIKEGLSPQFALQVTKEMASALEFAHSNGFIHRDVKPDNILFRKTGTPVLTDFGIARTIDPSGGITEFRSVIGSPHYMSPEQALGETLNNQTDIYSLGVVLYEMLTGTLPFAGKSASAISVEHATKSLPELPPELATIKPLVDGMLARETSNRFLSGQQVISEIDRILPLLGDTTIGVQDAERTRIVRRESVPETGSNSVLHETGSIGPSHREENTKSTVPAKMLGLGAAILVALLGGGYAVWDLIDENESDSSVGSTLSTAPLAGPTLITQGKPLDINLTPSDAILFLSATGEELVPHEKLADGTYKLRAWLPGYRAREFDITHPSSVPVDIELALLENPSVDEVYAYQAAVRDGSGIDARSFIQSYPSSALAGILRVKTLGEIALVEKFESYAEFDDEVAAFVLSKLYDAGWGVAEDKDRAIELASQASRFGYGLGEYQHALLLLEKNARRVDVQLAIGLLQKASRDGFFLAQVKLGDMYVAGDHVPKSIERAKNYLQLAADQGDREAQFQMGYLLSSGAGEGAQDKAAALVYYQKAAAQGHSGARAAIRGYLGSE